MASALQQVPSNKQVRFASQPTRAAGQLAEAFLQPCNNRSVFPQGTGGTTWTKDVGALFRGSAAHAHVIRPLRRTFDTFQYHQVGVQSRITATWPEYMSSSHRLA